MLRDEAIFIDPRTIPTESGNIITFQNAYYKKTNFTLGFLVFNPGDRIGIPREGPPQCRREKAFIIGTEDDFIKYEFVGVVAGPYEYTKSFTWDELMDRIVGSIT